MELKEGMDLSTSHLQVYMSTQKFCLPTPHSAPILDILVMLHGCYWKQ